MSLLNLHLLEKTIFTRGQQKPVLRGAVEVTLASTIESLTLCFQGKLHTSNTSENDTLEHSLAYHSLILFTKSPTYCLKTGRTRFGFEMNLPAGLPDSIQCRNLKISYTATATLTTTTGHTTRTSKPIEVIRLPVGDRLWIGDNITGIDSGKHVTPYCEYHITMDTQLLSRNSTLPLFLHFAPLIQGLQLKQVSVKLRQRRSVCHNHDWNTSQSSHTLPLVSSFPTSHQSGVWHGMLNFQIPDIATLVPTSNYEGYYENTHILFVSLVVSFPALTHDNGIRRVLDTITYQTVVPIHSPRAAEYEQTEHKLPLYANHPRSPKEIEVLTQHGLPIESCPPPYEEKA